MAFQAQSDGAKRRASDNLSGAGSRQGVDGSSAEMQIENDRLKTTLMILN
jgi:hypothetical protein